MSTVDWTRLKELVELVPEVANEELELLTRPQVAGLMEDIRADLESGDDLSVLGAAWAAAGLAPRFTDLFTPEDAITLQQVLEVWEKDETIATYLNTALNVLQRVLAA